MNTTPTQIGDKYLTLAEVKEVIDATCIRLGMPHFANMVTTVWNGRFTARMGDATYKSNRIRLSTVLFRRATEQERYETIVHELCHLVSYERYGRAGAGHGRFWQAVMREAGVEPKRCHNVNRTGIARRQATVKVYCGCQDGVQVSKKKRFNILNGKHRYRYNTCLQIVSVSKPYAKENVNV